jgi:hypothetical protein
MAISVWAMNDSKEGGWQGLHQVLFPGGEAVFWKTIKTARKFAYKYMFKPFNTMKNAVVWGVAPCRCGRLNRRVGGSYRLHLQGRKIRERRTSATPQKTAFFIVTAVKTSNPTFNTTLLIAIEYSI